MWLDDVMTNSRGRSLLGEREDCSAPARPFREAITSEVKDALRQALINDLASDNLLPDVRDLLQKRVPDAPDLSTGEGRLALIERLYRRGLGTLGGSGRRTGPRPPWLSPELRAERLREEDEVLRQQGWAVKCASAEARAAASRLKQKGLLRSTGTSRDEELRARMEAIYGRPISPIAWGKLKRAAANGKRRIGFSININLR